MAVYLSLTVAVIALSMLANRQGYINSARPIRPEGLDRQRALNVWVAAAIFVLLAGVSACRIAIGNDYWGYVEQFRLVMQGRHVSFEQGFNLVVWVVQSLFGYNKYLPVFAVFSVATAYFFVKALYDQGEWFGASVFLLMLGGYYFSSLNNVRYYFVLALAAYSMKYVIRKEYGKFILWILAGAMFHKSVLIVIPVYIGARWLADRKLNKYIYILAGIFSASLILFRDIYKELLFLLYPYYRDSSFDRGSISITNIVQCGGVLFLAILYYKSAIRDVVRNRFYLYLNFWGLLIYIFGSFVPEVSRIGYYLIISQIFLIPGILLRIEDKRLKYFFITGVVAAFLVYFGIYLHRAYDTNIRILPYLNWIFN
jgi:hypothetical protein